MAKIRVGKYVVGKHEASKWLGDDASTAANLIVGSVLGNGDDNGANVTSVADVVTFVHNVATAGDFAELWCAGTNWILDARYDADGAITLG